MKLAGVVVLYYPDSNVQENIKSYIGELDVLYAVDNTPTDNSSEFTDEKIKYIPNYSNLGIAYALNLGVENALKDGYEWLLTMDQDSSFSENSLSYMKSFIETKIINQKNEKIALLSPFHKTAVNCEKIPSDDSPLVVMTSGNIIDLNACKKVGGFKDWLFIDCVDFDYCLNLRNNGYDIIRLKDAVLLHNLGNVVFKNIFKKRIYSLNHSYLRRYYMVRNRHYIYDMYSKNFPIYCNSEIQATKKDVLRIILCEKQKFKKLLFMLKGYIDYKRGIKGKKK